MHDDRLPGLSDPKSSKLRFQVAGLCAILGVAVIAGATYFERKGFLTSSEVAHRTGTPYTRMWFDPAGALVGARIEPFRSGTKLTLERWSSDGTKAGDGVKGSKAAARETELPGFDGSQWTVSPDLSLVAWMAGGTLRWQALDSSGPISVPISVALPRDRTVLALGVVSDRSVAAVLSDGSVERWDSSDGNVLDRWRSRLPAADQAAISGDYLVLASAQAGRLLSYRFTGSAPDRAGWTPVEETVASDSPYILVVPAPGIMAQLTPAGIRIGGKLRSSPGPLLYAASRLSDVVTTADIVATGDFDGVMVLPPVEDAYVLAPAAPDSLVAADRAHIAVSGPRGTVLLKLGSEPRLTKNGRYLFYLGIAFLMLGATIAVERSLQNGLTRLSEVIAENTAGSVDVPARLPELPADLVKSVSTGECVLWAGAGLSAQSGFPLRQTFVLTLLQLATMESWADAPLLRKLTGLSFHDPEAALNQLTASIGRLRHHMVPYYRATFIRFACLSRSHGYLANLPLAGAITTNYDRLLQQVGQRWDANVITLRPERVSDAAPSKMDGAPFLLKLYGDPEANDSMLFSRDEFHAALVQSSPAAELLRHAFQANTLLFVGCSLDGLLADLNELNLPGEPRRKHFALAAVSDPVWEKQAAELTRRYGIEAMVCSADQIHAALPEFLDRLSRAVDVSHGVPRADGTQTAGAQTASARRAS